MSKIVAIEFGTGNLRIAALSKMRKSWGVSVFEEREIPPDDKAGFPEGPLVEAINGIFDQHKLPRDQVALSLPAQHCVFRYFAVDFTSDEAIRKTIKYAAEEYLPTTSIENVVVNYYKLGVEKEKTHLLVSIVEKKLIKSALQVLESCRIDPLTVDIDLLASLNTFKRLNLLSEPSRIMLVEVGERSSNIAVVVDGQLQYLRSPKLGLASMEAEEGESGEDPLEHLDLAGSLAEGQLDLADLEKDLVISISSLEEPGQAAAEESTESAEDLHEAMARRRKKRFLDRLVKDLRRTALSARKGAPEAIYLTGPGAGLPEVAEALAGTFNVPVTTPALLDHMPHALRGVDPGRCNALLPNVLGVGFKLLGVNESGAELRQEEFKFARRFEQVQGALVTAVCLAFGIVLLLCYQARQKLTVAKADYGDVLHVARQTTFDRWVRKDPQRDIKQPWLKTVPLESKVSRLQMELEDLLKAYGGSLEAEQEGLRSGLDVWLDLFEGIEEFSRRFPGQLILSQLIIKDDLISLKGKISPPRLELQLWDAVQRVVKKHPYMEKPTNNSRLDKDGQTQIVDYLIYLKAAQE